MDRILQIYAHNAGPRRKEAEVPFRTYKRTLFEVDTRQSELWSSLRLVVWGVFFALLQNGQAIAMLQISAIMGRFGGGNVWATASCLAGSFQFWAIYYRYPRLRACAAGIACGLWAGLTVALWFGEPRACYWVLALIETIACFFVLVHRGVAL